MSIRVIGAGLGRTGTHSLKLALERLTGEPCYHMVEVFKHMDHCSIWAEAGRGNLPDWDSLLVGYGSAVDWPSAAFWQEMSDALPDAVVVLSVRDPEKWWESASQTIFASIDRMPDPHWQDMIQSIFSSKTQMNRACKESCIAAFNKHNDEVIQAIPAERLVIWQASDGWEPLCKALGVPVPEEPFPVTNTREEFLAHVSKAAAVTGA